MHEQDNGILWKHTIAKTERAVVARMRELVVQFVVTLGNYEYVFAYKLDQAGGITLETRATGIVSVVAIDYGKKSQYGTVVQDGVLAQNHQHLIAVRIDPAIDSYAEGDTGVVVEESKAMEMNEKTNPFGNAYEVVRTPVEKAGWFDAEPKLNRKITMVNWNKTNKHSGRYIGYKFMPEPTQLILADPRSRVAKRALFAQHHVWVTGHRDDELWAAGEFTNLSKHEVGGVADMVNRGDWFLDSLEIGVNKDNDAKARKSSPVIWNVFGLTHNPRVEDWPVM
ncbi:putative copper amine oxidase protein [Phaeoacremonium minimum UCRPA7]|uniref:Amine oxidase n=1 Tax=Phaeoacremonium minimum (strain UCR-PA7) TaxID=1286976 RepID=R8BG70_PHAM7|nr:putative copper amine oxidase protein [Phaeoacremonium minimum UCRPA7]EON98289.1 putative copper amine oxidase protein [Phaeoacremonium minimum UCRPA7]